MNHPAVEPNASVACALLDLQRSRSRPQEEEDQAQQQQSCKRLKQNEEKFSHKRAVVRFSTTHLATFMDCPPYQLSQSDAETLLLYRDDIWYTVRVPIMAMLCCLLFPWSNHSHPLFCPSFTTQDKDYDVFRQDLLQTARVFRSVNGNMKGLKDHYCVRGMEAFVDYAVMHNIERSRRTVLSLLHKCRDPDRLHEQISLQSSQARVQALERGEQDARDAQEAEEEGQPSDNEESDGDTDKEEEEQGADAPTFQTTSPPPHDADTALKQLQIVNMKMLENIKEQRRLSEIASGLDLALEQVDHQLPCWNALVHRLVRRDSLSHVRSRDPPPPSSSSLFGLHLQGMQQQRRRAGVQPASWTALKQLPLKWPETTDPTTTTTTLEQIARRTASSRSGA